MTYCIQSLCTFATKAEADALKASVDAILVGRPTIKTVCRVVTLFQNAVAINNRHRKTVEIFLEFPSEADRDYVRTEMGKLFDVAMTDKLVAKQNVAKVFNLETRSSISACVVEGSMEKEAVK